MPSITQASIDLLKSNIDIVDLISHYIDVSRVGINFMALCPFHDDKTPSLSISQAKGLYHCHACGASGDGIKFVMQHQNVGFQDALEIIASFYRISLEYVDHENGASKKKSHILDSIASFYHNNLLNNQDVLQYLFSRGLSMDSIRNFKIGYCGASFETQKALQEHSLSYKEALEYGILIESYNRPYARFSNRITFPICSANGSVVGFGGRTLSNDKHIAKYINSHQSKIFNKSKILYGYNLARQSIYKQKSMIVCEGYLDVILLHQAGFCNAVATLGTALNNGHLGIINKDNTSIYMCYDGDIAGINAACKAARFLSKHSKDGGVVLLRDGLDPADMILQHKEDDFRLALKHAKSFIDFVLEDIVMKFDLKNPIQKQQALQASLEFMHTLNPLIQDDYKALKLPQLLNIQKRHITKKYEKQKDIAIIPSFDNISEANILVSMLDNEENFYLGMQFLDIKHFMTYREEFSMISNGIREHDKIMTLRFKSNASFSNKEFAYELRIFLLAYAKNLVNNISRDSNLIGMARIEAIGKLRNAIRILELERRLVVV
ncbi:DNA primase [Helicobacter muridarum]|uniref:DNA primase n=1 Tax=Helicobacter muridarum TaxID=216 RepID=A0A099U090_9HELI|nr:DNA primase [Helicobacter muridarum]TLE01186.1 DNA primase [Helicobacter muridarum]STQ86063.1 DNA primase [Helicobacter muridarum]